MNFAEKLKNLMRELDLTQSELAHLTGIGKSSVSQYLSGKNEPSRERKKEITHALGVQETYFETFEPVAEIQNDSDVNLSVALAAKLMGKSKEWVENGLQQGRFPWGYAVKMKKWSYWINAKKFAEYEKIKLPFNPVYEEC